MKKETLALLVLVAGMTFASEVRGDDTDILYTNTVQPNVMIMFDNSGSMNDSYVSCGSGSCPSKLSVAKVVMTNLVNSLNGVRLGLMKFRSHGAAMVCPLGSSKSTITTAIGNLTTGSVGTPLGDSLYDVGQYYKGLYSGYPSTPIQYECQRSYVLLITDGLPNNDNHNPVSDVATSLYTADAAAALTGMQNVVTYTIGTDTPEAAVLLQQTATNGGGLYFSATNENELQQALSNAFAAIFADVSASFTSPRIPSTEISGSTRAYVASFVTSSAPEWKGSLTAYNKNSSGVVPVDGSGMPLASAKAWDAAIVLNGTAASSRNIYTYLGTTMQSFMKTNTNITPASLGLTTAADRDKLVDFMRGVDTYDQNQNGSTTDNRAFKLGDVLHATPVLVFPPPVVAGADPDYQAFRTANAGRVPIVMAGANDGMLHAFLESTGAETWAFVPPDLFGTLKNMTPAFGDHAYYVDGSPIVADVKTSGAWRTLALFGERRGGRYYRALDVTNTTSPAHLWGFTDARMGETWSIPVIGKVKIDDGTTKYVAFVGGGYDTVSNNASGKIFYVIDLETGTRLWQYYNTGSSDSAYMNFSIAGSPAALDLNQDGFVDRVYVADVGGQLWKFDLSAPATLSGGMATNWTGKRLFVASPTQTNPPPSGDYMPAQAIYGTPAITLDSSGSLWVYFGTGDRNDPNGTSSNRFYGIMDNTSMSNGTPLTESSLVDVTSANLTATQGWYFRLGDNEKVLDSAELFNGLVLFGTYTPVTAATCGVNTGSARLYAIQMATGFAGVGWGSGQLLTSSDSGQPRGTSIGGGIPSKPGVVLSGSTATVVTGLSSKQLNESNVPATVGVRIIYWREVF